jgi:hemerythrin-like domain-containing protein
MGAITHKLDMTMMYAVHDALRRELRRIARVTARPDDDPRHVLRTAVGWELFKQFLRVHHSTEDDTVWAVLERALADKPSEHALLEAMEAEHGAIDPLLVDVDAALADRESGPQRLGELVDTLTNLLSGHLRHEETAALPLIDATLTNEQWQTFSQEHRRRIGDSAPRYLPWLLDEASPERVAAILGKMPPPLLNAYHGEWGAAYARLDLWSARDESSAP